MFQLTSSDIVQATLWTLIGFSVITWAIIFAKSWTLWRMGRANNSYGQAFWGAADLAAAASLDHSSSALGRIAEVGFGAVRDTRGDAMRALHLSGDIQLVLERSLRQQVSRERKDLEQGLSMLASVGSTAPFVGLFGTVWGIMHALQDISQAKSASLDVVAGPIGEALIATAIGIAAAIPAVLAYNYFLRRIKLCEAELEYFATDFLNLAVKTAHRSNGG
ncbi:MAG: MotA/TolQ/ExbB proton channel family protein [Methylococcaceae bacterium]|nr:MotA/TolQ/ExbB proton channel family protein [Methylococcaceae bacterium]